MTATAYTKDEHGEWLPLGDVVSYTTETTASTNLDPAEYWLAAFAPVVESALQSITFSSLMSDDDFRRAWRVLTGRKLARARYNGYRVHRRKHGGRWHKIDRRGKLPPPWKVRR